MSLATYHDLRRNLAALLKNADALVESGHNSAPHLEAMKRGLRQAHQGVGTNNVGDGLRGLAILLDAYHGYLPNG